MSGGQKLSIRNSAFRTQTSGQALVETALIVPFLLMIALNVVNFGYFFLVAVNLAAAPRSGALYSILGFQTPQTLSLPPAGPSGCPAGTPNCDVNYLTNQDMTGAIYKPSTNASVQVCSSTVGVTGSGASQTTQCSQFNSSPTYSPDADLEAPTFLLNRVDVTYTFTPLIPGTPFNIVLLASPVCSTAGGVTCTFHRMAEMREMN